MKPTVLPAEVQQRIAPRLEFRADHVSDQDEVIAAFVNRMATAFQADERSHQEGNAGLTAVPRD